MRTIATDAAPKAIGPYSQAIAEGGFLFTPGQIPLDPATGELVPGGLEASVARVFDDLGAILPAAGLTLANTGKTTAYRLSTRECAAMNAAYTPRSPNHRPTRAT